MSSDTGPTDSAFDPYVSPHRCLPGSAIQNRRGQGVGVIATAAEPAWTALRNGDAGPMQEQVAQHPFSHSSSVQEHLLKLGELAQALVREAIIPRPEWMWYLNPDTLDQPPSENNTPIRRIGLGPWDPLIYGVVTSLGETVAGHPAAGGWGAGRMRFVGSAEEAAYFAPREVVVAHQPLGNLAPLLWNASGLIIAEKSPGAHLFEVAEWLGVPAACGVEISQWTGGGQKTSKQPSLMAAVDGDRGPHRRAPLTGNLSEDPG